MNNISTEELCRLFEQRLVAIRPLQAALHDKVLTAKKEEHRERYHQAEIRLATAASQVHDAIALLKQSITKGPAVMSYSQWSREIRKWQESQDHAAELLGLPPDQEAPVGNR